ncbi:probable LRR receptor-like serine/threonine-protein kinase At3g47570 [Malus domestica]|uniref:probable LRR receptor-like serine/threonine-protein kinase At3g47570 n=1 Tax=Malus domestica TaxID=3750 RepID=UPI000498B956
MYLQVSFATFSKATDQFSSVNLTGVGSFEFVFKRVLYADNRALLVLVAMKVFSMLRHGASKSFIAEYEALRNIKHQNRVKVISTCFLNDFLKALVYELIQQRSLEEWLPDLHPPLVIEERTSIVYCDLKSSNVLLNTKVTGHVY